MSSKGIKNPCSEAYKRQKKEREAKERTLQTLMAAGKSHKKKEAAGAAKPKSASAKAGKKKQDQQRSKASANSDKAKKGSWQSCTLSALLLVSSLLKKSVGFEPNGQHKFCGEWPSFAHPPLIQPSEDPRNFRRVLEKAESDIANKDNQRGE